MTDPAWGAQSMVTPLRRVIMKSPEAAYRSPTQVEAQWRDLNYRSAPDFARAVDEHGRLVELLESLGCEVLLLPADEHTSLDSIYAFDAGLVLDAGVVLLDMGKPQRVPEAMALSAALADWGVPVAGHITNGATSDGGDLLWLDEQTLVIGRGFRTNAAGAEQLAAIAASNGIDAHIAHLPVFKGRSHVLHLMSLISMVADDLAVIHPDLLPVPVFELLEQRGIDTIEVTLDECNELGCNVLAVAPRQLVMAEGTPRVVDELRAAGCEVHLFGGEEIARKGDGGPTCLTRPLRRG